MSKDHSIRGHLVYRMSLYATIADRNGKIFFQNRFGLSLREYRILGVISYAQPVSVMRLADECYLDKGQVSRVVAKLESEGHVQRHDDLDDPAARGGKIALTPSGKDLVEAALRYGDELNDRAQSVLTSDERVFFSNLLDRLLGQARAIHAEVHRGPRTAPDATDSVELTPAVHNQGLTGDKP